jgi:Tetratricopeptide repeat
LANSLNNLGGYRNEVGRYSDALPVLQAPHSSAVRLATEHARPEHLRLHADILTNLATCYGGLDRREEALHAAVASVGVYRRLVEGNPTAYTHRLAKSLSNLGRHYGQRGHDDQAVPARHEAITLTLFDRPHAGVGTDDFFDQGVGCNPFQERGDSLTCTSTQRPNVAAAYANDQCLAKPICFPSF